MQYPVEISNKPLKTNRRGCFRNVQSHFTCLFTMQFSSGQHRLQSVPNILSMNTEYCTKFQSQQEVYSKWPKTTVMLSPSSQSVILKISFKHITTIIRYNKHDYISRRICSTPCYVQTPCFKSKYRQAWYSGQIKMNSYYTRGEQLTFNIYRPQYRPELLRACYRQWLGHVLSPMFYNNLPIFLCLCICCILFIFWITVHSSRWTI